MLRVVLCAALSLACSLLCADELAVGGAGRFHADSNGGAYILASGITLRLKRPESVNPAYFSGRLAESDGKLVLFDVRPSAVVSTAQTKDGQTITVSIKDWAVTTDQANDLLGGGAEGVVSRDGDSLIFTSGKLKWKLAVKPTQERNWLPVAAKKVGKKGTYINGEFERVEGTDMLWISHIRDADR
jgi:hypothetical protein